MSNTASCRSRSASDPTTAGYGVAFGAAGAVVLLSAVLILALRGISSRTKTTDERPPDTDNVAGVPIED